MDNTTFAESLFSFIASCPTPFHAVASISSQLQVSGFAILSEGEKWSLADGGKYVVIRNGSLIAFSIGKPSSITDGFRVIGAHTDSPSLQLKPHPRSTATPYLQFGVEKYGGALLSTWFDRELSLAGRISALSSKGNPASYLVDFGRPVLSIPSLAIHLNRKANDGQEINAHNDLCPVLSQEIATTEEWHELLLSEINNNYPESRAETILSHDLFCYDCAPPRFFGIDNEFICGPRLDNLVSCFIGLQALLQCSSESNCMLILTNHEEVGSTSSSGALSNFAGSVLGRICGNLEDQGICLKRSFFLSLDNAHASHPNFVDKSDSDHQVMLNKGPVVKLNSSQRYCSNANSAAVFRLLCNEVGVETQEFVMRSDMACGSTIGPLTTAGLGVEGVDVGVPTWAMHSIREITGAKDPELLFSVAAHFFNRKELPSITDS